MKGRRQFSRFAESTTYQTSVISPEGVSVVETLDESFTGLGLRVSSIGPLEVGSNIEVRYGEAPMRGVVRTLASMENGHFRVGVEWIRPA